MGIGTSARHALVTSVTACAVAAAIAAPAQAVVVQKHLVRFTSTGFDFGNADFVLGAPSGTGYLDWKYANGTITPNLTGTLHLDNVVGDCARMRIDYRDADDDPLATRFGGTVCAANNQHAEFTVDLEPYSSPLIQEVTVALEKQTTLNGPFQTVQASSMGAGINPDELKITTTGFDFGNSGWAFGEPTGNGSVLWLLEDDGAIRPKLGGTLHLNNIAGGCARMNLRYLRIDDTFITSRAGGVVCANDNAHHEFTVDLDPFASHDIGKVNVQLQSQNANGTFNVLGSEVESIAW